MARDPAPALAAVLSDLRDIAGVGLFVAGMAAICLALAPASAEAMQVVQPACPPATLGTVWSEGFGIGLSTGLAAGVAALVILAAVALHHAAPKRDAFDDGAAQADHPDVAQAIRACADRENKTAIRASARWGDRGGCSFVMQPGGDAAAAPPKVAQSLAWLAPWATLACAAALGLDWLLRTL